MRDEPNAGPWRGVDAKQIPGKVLVDLDSRTVAMWKSELAKECVTTHLPNQLALKMDGAEASRLFARHPWAILPGWPRVVGGRGGSRRRCGGAVCGVSTDEAASGADLGGSSKFKGGP